MPACDLSSGAGTGRRWRALCRATAGRGFSRFLSVLGQGLGHGLVQVVASQVFGDDLALTVEEVSCRNAVDAVFRGQFVAPTLPIEELLPGHVLLLGESCQLALILIQAD